MNNTEKKLVFIVEDDRHIATILTAYLNKEGYRVMHMENGKDAVEQFEQHEPDFVILDIKMPGKDGWTVLSELRERGNVPVMMLTALDTDMDKIYGLKSGADDYVIKPFNPIEVVTRVNNILKRLSYHMADYKQKIYITKNFIVNDDSHQVVVGSEKVDITSLFTSTEYRILLHLIRYPKRVFSRKEILQSCLSEKNASERTVDSHISNLRGKIESAGIRFVPESVRGFGYRFGD